MATEDQYRVEYNNLLSTISEKLNANDLRKLINMCRGMISTTNNIDDGMALFQELENAKKLGVDRLDILKTFLELLKKNALLKKVVQFETRRKAYRSGVLPSLRHAATEVYGVIKIVCNFGNIGKGLLVLAAGLALHCCNNREEYIDTFNKVVLPTATKLIGTTVNSLCFIVQAETVQALETLWKQYQDGTLQKRLQQFLRSDNENILQLIGEDVQVAVSIDEQEYKNALLDLMILQTKVFSEKEEDRSRVPKRNRRNSDSILYVKSNENEMTFTLLKLKQAGINFQHLQEKIESLEKEISGKFEPKLQEASGQATERKPFDEMTEGQGAVPCRERDDRPMERRRRNSDSVLYVNPKGSKGTVALSKLKQAKIESQQEKISSLEKRMVEYKAKVKELELITESVSCSEKDDRPVERRRRNSDSVMYVNPKESEVEAVLSKLKQALVEFQQGKVSSLEKEVLEYKAKVKEPELTMLQIAREALTTSLLVTGFGKHGAGSSRSEPAELEDEALMTPIGEVLVTGMHGKQGMFYKISGVVAEESVEHGQ
ncbi:uncharacterized protein LOC144643945 [Oculina patagonica]